MGGGGGGRRGEPQHGGMGVEYPAHILHAEFKRGAWGRGREYPSTYPACWVQEGCMGEGSIPQHLSCMPSSRGVHGGGEGSTPAPILDAVFKRGAWGRGGEYPSTYPACWVQEGCMGRGVPQYLPYMLSSRGVHGEGRGVAQYLPYKLSSRGVHGRRGVEYPQHLSYMLSSRGL